MVDVPAGFIGVHDSVACRITTSERRDTPASVGHPFGPNLGHFYEAARQVTRLLVTFFGDRQTDLQ